MPCYTLQSDVSFEASDDAAALIAIQQHMLWLGEPTMALAKPLAMLGGGLYLRRADQSTVESGELAPPGAITPLDSDEPGTTLAPLDGQDDPGPDLGPFNDPIADEPGAPIIPQLNTLNP